MTSHFINAEICVNVRHIFSVVSHQRKMLKTSNKEGKVRKKSMVSFAESPSVIGVSEAAEAEGNGLAQAFIPDIGM